MSVSRSTNFIKCPYCNIKIVKFAQYTHHLKLNHEWANNFIITCHIPECHKTFKTVASYKQHNYRNHGTKDFFSYVSEISEDQPAPSCTGISTVTNGIQDMASGEVHEDTDDKYSIANFRKHFALFILNVKEKHLLPDSLTDSLTSELDFFVKFTEESYKYSINKGLLELGASLSDSKTFSALLGEGTQYEQANIQLDSRFKLKKFIKQNLPFVAAEEYLVSCQDEKSRYHYIPITDLLKVLISNQDIYQEISNNFHERHHSHVLYDTCDGTIFDREFWSIRY